MEQYFAETLQVSIGSWHDVIYPKLATMLRKRFECFYPGTAKRLL